MTGIKKRTLRDEEATLLKHLLRLANDKRTNLPLPTDIETMDDGGVGSIQFGDRGERKYGRDIVMVEYIDTNNVPVIITLIEDNAGNLFEIDFWKSDLSKLIRYPAPEATILLTPS